MHAAWSGFATTGDPGWDPHYLTRRSTLRIGEEWRLIDDLHSQERQVWY
jgi:carboxylesterase type B